MASLNSDAARRWTDAELESLERNIAREYQQAAREMRGKQAKWLERFERERSQRERALDNTKEAREAHKAWLRSQTARSEWFDGMVEGLSESAHHANVRAADMVNDRLPRVFAENANMAAFAVDGAIGYDTRFSLVNEDAVRYLMGMPLQGGGGGQLVPEVVDGAAKLGPGFVQSVRRREVDYPKDMRWNRQKFTSAITQGILQGENIPDIVKRTEGIYGQNRNAAISAARTATTNAENAGRISSFERAQRLGIDMEIEWDATLDTRTRPSHRDLDGERIKVGQTFGNGCRWPCDPMGPANEVWNCFIGETRAIPLGGVERSYRRFYDGPAVTVKTASGVEFTCTPNHPILTSEGWVSAGLLHDGDDLFLADLGNTARRLGVEPDVEHVGTCLDAVHELASMLACERASGLTVHFHEDVPARNVDVVTEERVLRVNLETLCLEPVDENVLEHADALAPGDGVLAVSGGAPMHAPDGVMGRLGEPGALLGGSVRHALVHSLRAVPGRDSRALEPIRDGVATDAELFCESLDALSAVVKFDKVVEVEVKTISEHVYNLQTESGAYLVSGSDNGNVFVVSHNCRCRADGRVVGFDGERGDWADEGPGERWSRLPEGMTYEEWKAGKAVSRDESYQNGWGRVSPQWSDGTLPIANQIENGIIVNVAKTTNAGYEPIDLADAMEEIESGKTNSLSEWVVNGELVPERKRVHDEIIDDLLEGKTPSGEQPKMTMLGGGPASGKSSVMNPDTRGNPHAITVDPDDMKKRLPGFAKMAESDTGAAAFYHEESSALAKRFSEVAYSRHIDAIYDGTGDGSVRSVMKKVDAARANGYRVEAKYVTIDTDEAIRRNQKRYDDAKAKGETPRLPPPEMVRKTHAKVTDISVETAPKFDYIEVWDNNGGRGEQVLIATGGNGRWLKPVSGMESKFEAYLAKGQRGLGGFEKLPDGSYMPKG